MPTWSFQSVIVDCLDRKEMNSTLTALPLSMTAWLSNTAVEKSYEDCYKCGWFFGKRPSASKDCILDVNIFDGISVQLCMRRV